MWGFYLLAAVSIWLGLLSVRGGYRFVRYVKREFAHKYPEYTPRATIFVPCRGADKGLAKNISAVIGQDYPAFEVIFVSDTADDPAFTVVKEAIEAVPIERRPPVKFLSAGAATNCGQKVHNLRFAVDKADPKSEVFAFVDTDARPDSRWLRYLVGPLQDANVGAATGYRWFIPESSSVMSHLRSVWNASIASALGDLGAKNFCWGGSTAIRREVFERVRIKEAWQGTVSDDFALTRALHNAGLPIKFVPQCLTSSFEDCGFQELVEFTTRQLKITRTYAPQLWKGVLLGSLVFSIVFFGGILLVIIRVTISSPVTVTLALLLLIFVLGSWKAYLRLRAVRLVFADGRVSSFGTTLAHIVLWPAASLLFLLNSLAAAFSRRIVWRGITYELKSPTEAVIIRRKYE